MERKKFEIVIKRTIDIVLSFLGLIFLTPLFLVISLLIKFDSKGPIFFRQERVSRDSETFKPWKFRTMSTEAPSGGFGHHVSEDNPHITSVGKVLREWGLDELPQLINVLKGEMSLVGPRPVQPWQVEEYDDYQKQRLKVKPGLTGWALIHGRNKLPWKKKIELDIWYVNNWDILLDLKILIMTVWIVLIKKEGVYGEGDFDV